jgi:hypothetical protein
MARVQGNVRMKSREMSMRLIMVYRSEEKHNSVINREHRQY